MENNLFFACRIKCTYAEIHDANGNLIFSLQAKDMAGKPAFIAAADPGTYEGDMLPVKLTAEAIDVIDGNSDVFDKVSHLATFYVLKTAVAGEQVQAGQAEELLPDIPAQKQSIGKKLLIAAGIAAGVLLLRKK